MIIGLLTSTLDTQQIELLREIPDLIPVRRDNFSTRAISVINREQHICRNYLSANRRGFYKVVFLNEGTGVFTLGLNTYYIYEPTILFIHPDEIISWKNLAPTAKSTGHFCLFKKSFIYEQAALKALIDKYHLFTGAAKNVIRLPEKVVEKINELFLKMHEEDKLDSALTDDALQAYIQLIMVESYKVAQYLKPDVISGEYKRIHDFFRLLEKETSNINLGVPIRIKTAKEFADNLAIHPNHLNALLKKQTGHNVSTHIKNRLLEESKILLLQTDWTLEAIGYAVGFAEQSSFSYFFKKNTSITPAEFRKAAAMD